MLRDLGLEVYKSVDSIKSTARSSLAGSVKCSLKDAHFDKKKTRTNEAPYTPYCINDIINVGLSDTHT